VAYDYGLDLKDSQQFMPRDVALEQLLTNALDFVGAEQHAPDNQVLSV